MCTFQCWLLPVSENIKLNPQQHDVGTWMKALSYITAQMGVADVMKSANAKGNVRFNRSVLNNIIFLLFKRYTSCFISDLEGLLSRTTLASARLARKQQNYTCAERLLIEEIQRNVQFVINVLRSVFTMFCNVCGVCSCL